MSEKSKPNQNKYTYKYIQFTATPTEKKQIKHFANKENFKTTSEFVRRIVFDYIRRQENPELFHSAYNNSINPLQIERIAKNIREIMKNQEIILQREDKLEEMRELVINLNKLAESNALAKERETIIQLLEKHNSLSLRQIQEETKLAEEIIFKIISDMNLFKITSTGRFALR
ncbi:MAG: hypothetical protein HWN80_17145 [Candidatus Lokiarchaeota archaeon]|nr:hypothetical protein [Candidatus Lokiarchaeota archaeon]